MRTIVTCLALLIAGFSTSVAQYKQGLVWEISGKGMKQPAYIFGTIHMYDTTRYELPQLPMQLLDKVDKAYFEMDFSNMDVAAMMAQMFITDSTQYLDKLLDTASISKLRRLAANSPMLKALGDRIYTIKPILLMQMLSAGNTKGATIDYELYKVAAAKNKAVGGLETVQEQMDAVNKVPIRKQLDMMRKSIQDDFAMEKQLRSITDTYVQQNIEDMMTVLNDNMPVDASFDDAIRSDRNVTMADKIDVILQTEHPLIAVGSGHLGNNNGLLKLLQQKGYKIKNVPFVIKKAHQ